MATARRRTMWGALGVAVGAAACGGAPAPEALPTSKPKALEPPRPLARWERTMEHPLVGPRREEGTIAVVGGKRVLLKTDNTIALERADSARPLDEAVLVPTTKGDMLVARSGRELLRFDDPLGSATSIAALEEGATLRGPVFGGVFVGEPTRLLDVPSGTPVGTERFGALEPDSVVFLDEFRGAASFDMLSFTTNDAGKTWTRVDRAEGFHALFGGVATSPYQGALRTVFSPSTAVSPRTAAWVARMDADPLWFAAASGVPDPASPAHVYVVAHGVLSRVDLRTAEVVDMIELDSAPVHFCEVTWGGPEVLLAACNEQRREGSFVAEVSTAGGTLHALRVTRNDSVGRAVTSRSGGVAFDRGCTPGLMTRGVCVRQPDGEFSTFLLDRHSALLPKTDGTTLAIAYDDQGLTVVRHSTKGAEDVGRAELPYILKVAFLEGDRTYVIATALGGTFVGRLDATGALEGAFARQFDQIDFVANGGAFVGWTPAFDAHGTPRPGPALLVTRGPEEPAFTVTELPAFDRVTFASAVGFTTPAWTRIGYGELGKVPEPPPDPPSPKPSGPMARLSCSTVGKITDDPDARPRESVIQGAPKRDWMFAGNKDFGEDIAALAVVTSPKGNVWELRWMSSRTQTGVLSAEVAAPTAGTPTLLAADVHRGALAVLARTNDGDWMITAKDGHADASREVHASYPLRVGEDGALAWQFGEELWFRAPGKTSQALARDAVKVELGTPSLAGVLLFSGTGSIALPPGGDTVNLAPHLYRREPSLPGLRDDVLGKRGAPTHVCAPGARGRTISIAGLYIQVALDGQVDPREMWGSADVLLDGVTPCIATARTGSGSPRMLRVSVDFVRQEARALTTSGPEKWSCAWEAPAE